jgi:phosphatidyl-myo-inositol dimannoside synthase
VTRKLNILCLVTDAYGGTGGIALYNRDVIEAMCGDDQVARVVALPRVIAAPLEPMSEKLEFDQSSLGGAVAYLRALWRQLRSDTSFDIIYCAHVNLIPVAYLAAKWLGVPWALCLYGVEGWARSPRYLSNKLSSKADLVISLSGVTQERFLSWCKIAPDKCCVVPNAVHLDDFGLLEKDPQLVARYGLADRRVIMTLGRLDPSEKAKGFDRIIELLPELKREIHNLSYLIVGKGGDQARLEALAKTHGVTDSVIFAGFVSETDKPRYYALADAYVMPSTLEGFGFVYIEAMACGLPVVGSSIDGSREALRDGALGALVDPFDPHALKGAILSALKQPKAIPAGLDYFSFDKFQMRLISAIRKIAH